MRRYGQVIGIKPERIAAYEQVHAAVWPEVLATIRACNIRNYSIFRPGHTLFAYFEYTGDDVPFMARPRHPHGGYRQETLATSSRHLASDRSLVGVDEGEVACKSILGEQCAA
jgi:hypothetical protein